MEKTLTDDIRKPQWAAITKLLAAMAVLGCGLLVYLQWGSMVLSVVEWQKTLHTLLASHVKAVAEDVYTYGAALIALSFAYGVFHAAGPGHGKAVIVTYLGTHKERVWKGIFISFSAAILQSVIAIVLVSGLARLLKLKFSDVHNYGNEMALVSYALVALLGVMLCVGAIRRYLKARADRERSIGSVEHTKNHEHQHEHKASGQPGHQDHVHQHHEHHHAHGGDCGCSHVHAPSQDESVWQTVMVIVSMGFRPCSGAIVVLIYAHLVDAYAYGVIATLMMGLGTGLSVSALAAATLFARARLERFMRHPEQQNAQTHADVGYFLRFIGGVLLIAIGWSLYSAASALTAGHPLF